MLSQSDTEVLHDFDGLRYAVTKDGHSTSFNSRPENQYQEDRPLIWRRFMSEADLIKGVELGRYTFVGRTYFNDYLVLGKIAMDPNAMKIELLDSTIRQQEIGLRI